MKDVSMGCSHNPANGEHKKSQALMKRRETFGNPATAAFRLVAAKYPGTPPFHPGVRYPESRSEMTGPSNLVYEAVRDLFHLLKLDEAGYSTPSWNPLGEIILPGDKVVIKPNFLWHAHKYHRGEWEQLITHGSVIRAVVDYVLLALRGQGEVWITDGPQLDADWKEIVTRTGVASVCEWYQTASSVPVHLLDLRDTWEDVRGDVLYGSRRLPGDPSGGTVVDLGQRSRFIGHSGAGRYFGATYNQAETNAHHAGGRHEYRISRAVASADVFINLPKMKTHKKVGATLCLKNLVGVNTGRNWLPHHTDGDPSNGGDQFPTPSVRSRSERWIIRKLQRLTLQNPRLVAPLFRLAKAIATPVWGHTRETIRTGNWYGNDTTWRMVHDINRCLLYSDGEKFPISTPKRYFAVVDGVVGGDNEGPSAPDRYEAGVLIAGFNPVAVDCVAARIMGLAPMKMRMLCEAFTPSDLPLAPFNYSDITIRSNRMEWNGNINSLKYDDTYHFRPHFAWRGHIEWDNDGQSKAGK